MSILASAASIHKRTFEKYLAEVGTDVLVRQRADEPAPSDAVQKILGSAGQEFEVGDTQTLKVIWSTGYKFNTDYEPVPENIARIGRVQRIDALLRCSLSDALLAGSPAMGLSVLETCHDLVYAGEHWTVLAVDRTGLPPLGPYILWAAVAKSGS